MLSKPKRLIDEEVLKQRRSEPCWVCGAEAEASHIKTRKSGGPDTLWNVVPKCRAHHVEWGWSAIKFLRKYPGFAFKMKALGWSWESGKLSHPGLDRC